MGNRAVITTKQNYETNGIGIYVHWNGGYDSINAFLAYCDAKGYRRPEQDCYGWARLAQVIANWFGGDTSIGVDTCNRLDTSSDNGTYFIENWRIVGRTYETDCREGYGLEQFLNAIDERQPENEQLGSEKIHEYMLDRNGASETSLFH